MHTLLMNRFTFNSVFLLFFFLIVSCNRKVCPTYFDSFQPKQGSANQFFAYFESDELLDEEMGGGGIIDATFLTPDMGFEEDTLLVAKQDTFKNSYGLLVFANGTEPVFSDVNYKNTRNKNGVVKKNNFLSDIFSSPRRRRNANYPKRVSTKNPRPFKVEEVEEDSTHQIVQKKGPPKLADQLYYEMEFGNPDAVDSTSVEEENVSDSLATENIEEGLEENGEEGKKKKRKKKKDKKKKKKGKETEGEFNDTEVVSEEAVLPKRKKKDKKKKKKDEAVPPLEDDASPD